MVLQLANDYYGTDLYKRLFQEMSNQGVSSLVAVPLPKTYVGNSAERDDNILDLPCFSALDRLLFYRKQRRILESLQRTGTLNSVDVVHAHTLFSAGYCALQLKKKYGIPYIVAVRNTDVSVFFKKMPHLRRTGVEIMRQAEKIVFLSPAYQDSVLERYVPNEDRALVLQKSIVIPNGIAQLFFDRKAQPRTLSTSGSLRLIYVGELSSNKNLELTIQAAEQLRQQGMEISVTAVGAVLEEKYHKLISETPFLTHYDRCPQEKVIEYLQNADIFVMPSHTETFGLVYAEAMSQGLPVLYTRGQGFDGHFPDGLIGYAVSDEKPEEMASKIQETIANYTQMSTQCVQLAKRFRWEDIAGQYKELYSTAKRG